MDWPGVMGAAMCGHLLDDGRTLTVFNRSRGLAEPLLRRGARWASSRADASADADVICTMVGFPADVRSAGGRDAFRRAQPLLQRLGSQFAEQLYVATNGQRI
jgi:3-hydroxyisobutyrate dehydrogenase-like beta-hydroxyacid dehydrogenase